MSDAFRARRGLSAVFSLALALSVIVYASAPARAQSCEDDYTNSGIAWSGTSVIIVSSPMQSDGGNLYYFWQTANTGTWHKQLVASASGCPSDWGSGFSGGTTTGYRSNAIAWTGDSVVIAAVDQRNGGLYYWWQAKGSSTWHQQTVAGGPPGCCSFGSVVNGNVTPYVMGYSMPSIAWTGKSVVIAATDTHGLHYWFQEKGNTTWDEELVSSQYASRYAVQPSIAWTGTSVVITDVCNGNSNSGICYYWQLAGSSIWHHQVVDSGYSQYPSIAWTGSAVVIAALQYPDPTRYPSGVAYWWQTAGTATWRKQQVNASREFSAPSIAWTGASVVIAAVDETTKQQLLDYWWQPANATAAWSLQHPQAGRYSGWTDPRSIAWTGQSVVITSTDACGDLDYWWQKFGTSTWHKQRIVTNPNWRPGTC